MTKALELGELANYATVNVAGNTVTLNTVLTNDSATVGGNTATNLRTYSEDKAANAFANAVSVANTTSFNQAANAYANAVSYADAKVANLVNSAPAALDTLLELAAALGNDASFSTTVTTGIGNAYTNAYNQAVALSGNAYSNATSYADTAAGTSYTNATAFAANASNISSGTLATARLPATANVSTAINVGANVSLTTSGLSIGTTTANNTIVHIRGDWVSGNSTIKVQGINTNTTGIGLYNTAGVRKSYYYYGTDFASVITNNTPLVLSIDDGVTNNFVIAANGNIGISNTSPSYKLQVSGGAINIDYNQAIRLGGSGDWMIGGSNTEISIGSTAVNKTILLYTVGSTPTLKANNTVSLGYNGSFTMPQGYANAYASDYPSLYIPGKAMFASNTSGSSYPDFKGAAIVLGPSQTRSGATGLYNGGIAFDHLLNYTATGNFTYAGMPHAWIGLKLVDTPGYERSSLVIATRNVTDGTGTTIDRLTVAPQGWVTKPYQPSFSAYVNSNVTSNGGTMPFNALRYDTMGNFNTSTYAFTAPVAGKYLFTVYDNFNATSGTGNYLYFAVNGSAASAYMYAVAPSSWFLLGGSAVLSLSASDSVTVVYAGSSLHPDYGSSAWGLFSGILIG